MKKGCFSDEQLLQYLDGDLPEVAAHLEGCRDCHQSLKALDSSWELLTQVPDIEPSYTFRAQVWESIRTAPTVKPLQALSWWRRLVAGVTVAAACYGGMLWMNSGLNSTRQGLSEPVAMASKSPASAQSHGQGVAGEEYFIPSEAELTIDDLDDQNGEAQVRIAAAAGDSDGFEGLGNPSHDLLDSSEI